MIDESLYQKVLQKILNFLSYAQRSENEIDRRDSLYQKALDYFDLSNGKTLFEVFKGIRSKFLIMTFKSDWLYPTYQSKEILKICKLAGIEATYCEINSTYGHDAFLLEIEEETHLVRHFLKRVFNGYAVDA